MDKVTVLKNPSNAPTPIKQRVADLMAHMGLDEKIGQMSQMPGGGDHLNDHLAWSLRESRVGSVLNVANPELINEMQRICVEESRLGIPLLIGRDVIHGFKTIFPIPLGQAASWDPEIVRQGASVAAMEAAGFGINWTFAPMVDISRDPRWGRIAESLGEDPYLCGELGAAMVEGFQGTDLNKNGSIAACAKHFAGYGASEGGRDYATVNVPVNEMHNVYLRPFKKVADAGVATFMSAFCDLNGVPATGNSWLLDEVLRKEWQYHGVLVSDWDSVVELSVHGFTTDDEDAAFEAVTAGVDMEMASSSYIDHLENLVNSGRLSMQEIDEKVERILTLKFELGLFENPYTNASDFTAPLNHAHLRSAKEAAVKSCVLLKNKEKVLPLSKQALNSIALIGPLADDNYEPLGTWIFDGEAQHTITCRKALVNMLGRDVAVNFSKGLDNTRSNDHSGFAHALETADKSDAIIVVVGEESFMSGEAHSRANINLPGQQEQLIEALKATGKPLIVIVMAGRPLTIEHVVNQADAVLYAWHPGTMGGPAIADLLFGVESPSGKLPVTFPRMVGQIPLYYSHKNTGRPATDETVVRMQDVPVRAPQTSLGMTSFYLDAGHKPLFQFGYGLSYGEFQYAKITTSHSSIGMGQSIDIHADILNAGEYAGEEVVQLYVRDLVGSVTRPVKELKGFQRLHLKPGERQRICFTLHTDDLAFFNRNNELVTEPGKFHVWIGGSSDAPLWAEFEIHE
ncbi:MAG: beta-glucosidase BglX [Gammaproteobacteria bacterium]|nr:beta-glucosidase BglX [Gammaproteobacteria bacterium]NNM14800.1 beta-glucosidase BglX [Gammaproteobacteria bacterium]